MRSYNDSLPFTSKKEKEKNYNDKITLPLKDLLVVRFNGNVKERLKFSSIWYEWKLGEWKIWMSGIFYPDPQNLILKPKRKGEGEQGEGTQLQFCLYCN